MIEMVYKGNSEEKRESRKGLPRNIRQIGETGNDKKVYMEDYAATYLMETDCAVLLGECTINGGTKYFFVSAAIGVPGREFDDESWAEIYRDAKEYFDGKEILGWAKKIEEGDNELQTEWEDIHREQFPGEDRLLFLYCPEDSSGMLYITENGGLKRQGGYYIYYEKNEAMQNYMVKQNEGHSVEKEEGVSDSAIDTFRKKIAEKKRESEKAESTERGRLGRFLHTASLLLVLTILVVGAAMIRNYRQVNTMREELEVANAQITETSYVEEILTEITPESETMTGTEVQTEAQTGSNYGNQATGTEHAESLNARQTESDVLATAGEVNKMQAEYTVKEGDTLANVCRMYYGSIDKLEEICRLNDITDPNTILPGQKLVLP